MLSLAVPQSFKEKASLIVLEAHEAGGCLRFERRPLAAWREPQDLAGQHLDGGLAEHVDEELRRGRRRVQG